MTGATRTSASANTSTDERAGEPRAQPESLEIVVGRDAEAHLEARPYDRLDLLRALADEARVHRGALAPRDDVADVGHDLGIGHAHLRDPRAQRLEESDRLPHAACHLVVQPVEEVVLRHGHAKPGDALIDHQRVVGHPAMAGRAVARVAPGDDLEQARCVPHRPRHRAHVVIGPRQGHDPGAAHPPVGGLEPDDPAARGGQPDRAAGVRAERAEREPGGDGDARSARRAAGDVAGAPGIVRVAMMRIVTERDRGPVPSC